MPSYFGYDSKIGHYHIRGDLGPHCAECAGVSEYLCDYPVGKDKTCDRSLCHNHANEIGPELHYCRAHFIMYDKWLKKDGENIEMMKRIKTP